ncbi:siderophore-interacting protein [Kitasatospora sp. NPDC096147]|uniref:siderophore-interacting protein n=1 Tax=Kitasatospora sp. NPDC096147 TaxID=3364093 RepID=UPI0037FE707A
MSDQPFAFFRAEVVRTTRLSTSLLRVTLGGAGLAGFASGGRDQSFSLFLPHPGQSEPVVPVEEGEGWFWAWRALPEEERAVMRSYTVRAARPELLEVDVDFVLHGDTGPASAWAGRAAPGDRVLLLGPAVEDNTSVGFRPPAGTDLVLLAADETALPAAAAILEWLPAGTRVSAYLEVPTEDDRLDLTTAAEAEIHWLVRDGARPGLILDALRSAALPTRAIGTTATAGITGAATTSGTPAATGASDAPYAWVAGEAAAVRSIRRHLVGERGFDRKAVEFTGYWRLGSSEEQLRAEAITEARAAAEAAAAAQDPAGIAGTGATDTANPDAAAGTDA